MRGPSPFWAFSLRFYASPGVAEACLELQDRGGADINVLFFVIYLSLQGKLLDPETLARMDGAASAWRQHAVLPLRGVRRYLKAPPEAAQSAATAALRSEVKRVELEAERLQQLMLESLFPVDATGGHDLPANALPRNLEQYARFVGTLPPEPLARVRVAALALCGNGV